MEILSPSMINVIECQIIHINMSNNIFSDIWDIVFVKYLPWSISFGYTLNKKIVLHFVWIIKLYIPKTSYQYFSKNRYILKLAGYIDH